MNKNVMESLSGLVLGDLVQERNMAVVPLFPKVENSIIYLTLDEAIGEKLVTIKELTFGGIVSELKVVNKGSVPVLLLDGEELIGAMQNRVLNTTILLKEKSETVIPVSCVERGRWSHVSDVFSPSNSIMPSIMRRAKSRSVSVCLNDSARYYSDQKEIWDNVSTIERMAGVESSTGALKDVLDARKSDIDFYVDAFSCQPNQRGLLVFINGAIAGFDMLSFAPAYKVLHDKFVRSYAADAAIGEKSENKPSIKEAKAFIVEALMSQEQHFESVGYGQDYRYSGRNVAGSALVYADTVIHAAFFRNEVEDKPNTRMAGLSRRREFREEFE